MPMGANRVRIASSPLPIMSPGLVAGRRMARLRIVRTARPRRSTSSNGAPGKKTMVSARAGINAALTYSPDGKKLAVTLSGSNGNLDVYLLELANGQLTRLTDDPAIDTEAVFSPDGTSIYFTSDRSGAPQIYRLGLGSNERPRRVTFTGSYNARPRVSPDGKQLAVTDPRQRCVSHCDPGSRQWHSAGVVQRPSGRIPELCAERRDADIRRPRTRPGCAADRIHRRPDFGAARCRCRRSP
jgi:Tol biopolymer transport system component